MQADTTQAKQRLYGNLRRGGKPGLWDFPAASAVLFVGVIFAATVVGLFAGLPAGAIFGITLAAFVWRYLRVDPRDGETRLQKTAPRVVDNHHRRLGRTRYRSGPSGVTPSGRHQLPGLLAPSLLSEAEDAHGNPFAIIAHPHVRNCAIVLESEPDGASLADQEHIDDQVADYGIWLAKLCREPGLFAAQVSIEDSPDPGTRLRHMLAERQSDTASEFSRNVMKEIAVTHPKGAPDHKAHIVLIYRMVDAANRHVNLTEKAAEIGLHLPRIYNDLASTGAGLTAPVDAQRMCEIVHQAYNLRAGEAIETARAAGIELPLSWDDIGPAVHDAQPGYYHHDGCISITWEMAVPPRNAVMETVFKDLLEPHPAIPRKRVTLNYRVHSPAEAAHIVDTHVKNAMFKVNQTPLAAGRDMRDVEAAQANSNDESRGAEVLTIGMLVTATVPEGERKEDLYEHLPVARAAVEAGGNASHVNLRVAQHWQQAAFAAALPVGVWLPEYLRLPPELREAFK